MSLIIAGHQRSGTSLLQVLCNRHPQIMMTMEFANFVFLDVPFGKYVANLLRYWMERAVRDVPLIPPRRDRQWQTKWDIHLFYARYLFLFVLNYKRRVDIRMVNSAFQRLLPEAVIVGDKYPDYIYHMDVLANVAGLRRLVIYRDARDVVSSTLQKVRTDWRGLPFTQKMDTAEKVAHRWVEAIEIMERYQAHMYCLRYEELVANPKAHLAMLGQWLGVDGQGFPEKWVKNNRVGKHKQGLTEEEIAIVFDIAGPTMTRLGYL